VSEACSTDVMRRLPAGFPRMAVTAANPASIPSKCGPTVWIRRSPASVGATLRVLRVRSRNPSRASRSRMMRLRAGWDTPSCAAARVKLRSLATARRAIRSLMVSRAIYASTL
jgi:hypothetical protein